MSTAPHALRPVRPGTSGREGTAGAGTPPREVLSPAAARALEGDLSDRLRGEVRFGDGARALYATDASNYRQTPIGVVLPRDVGDVVEAVAAARRHRAPVLPRSGGTSLAGQCCNTALVIDTTKHLHRVLGIDPQGRRARIEPGCVLDTLRAAAERFHLTFGPDPATHDHCTLGGMIGNNSCGVHSVMAGKTDDNVEALDVLLYDGTRMTAGAMEPDAIAAAIAAGGRAGDVIRRLVALRDRHAGAIREGFPDIPRCVSGYNLKHLLPENGFHVARALVGSEGTCATVLEATVKLVPSPPWRALVVLGFEDVFTAADRVPSVLDTGPIGLEGMDDRLVHFMRRKGLHAEDLDLLPEGGGWLLAEYGGDTAEEAAGKARSAVTALGRGRRPPAIKLLLDRDEQHRVWVLRESGLGATANVPGEPESWPGWEDSAVPPERLGDYLRDFRRLLDAHGYGCALYGHFGQGCLHVRIDFDLARREGIDRYRVFIEQAAELVVRYGGSLSGEHGDGQARGVLLDRMYGPELMEAFREFKRIWDPDGAMNPGKLVDADPPEANLRLGAVDRTAEPGTYFRYPEDRGSFTRATLRCVGVGACRRMEGGTMCPSYRVTREEKHSTRGRARLLFEMLEGDPLAGGWRDRDVREALDLCLACKGCKGECPVNVDMATYKAEFMAHYYARRLRPPAAYAMGLIHEWSGLAARWPAAANALMHAPLAGRAMKGLLGIASARDMPRFASRTFRHWFRARPPGSDRGAPVVLWPDTFHDHFHPEVLIAAVRVLEQLGYRPWIPEQDLCCGRPLYDFGFLDRARRRLREVLDALRPRLEAGTPVVALEPSCAAVFRDELVGLFPDDADAQRLARQTHTLAEFLEREAGDRRLPPLPRRALLHAHCHQRAVLGVDADLAIARRLGLDLELLDSGCCGMAGSFGFERRHHETSMRIGERVLLPRVRRAEQDVWILADGFSCREQIRQGAGRRARHLAEVLAAAFDA